MAIGIEINDGDWQQLRKRFGEGQTRVIIQAAVSDTVRAGVTLMAKRLGEEVNLPAAVIKDTIHAKKGSFGGGNGSILLDRGKAVWLAQFLKGAQRVTKLRQIAGAFKQVQRKGGVTVKVRKHPTPKYPATELLPRAFLGNMPKATYLGIFERTGIKRAMKFGMYKGKVREVIKRLRGPRPLSVFLHARGESGMATLIDEVQNKLATAFQKNLQLQINRAISGGISAQQIAQAEKA